MLMPVPVRRLAVIITLGAIAVAGAASAACGGDRAETLTIYSGRTDTLVGPLLERFSDETGIDVDVRYGDTAELAATILEEGDNSPADVFFGQDAGALGALAAEGRLQQLPQETLGQVDARFRAPDGRWVGVSGRARVVVFNTTRLSEDDVPDSIDAFTAPEWRGRIGWVPTNGSFQAFVTALRLTRGEDAARAWLQAMKANEPKEYANNSAAVRAVADGEVDVAFANHYYLYRFLAEQGGSFPARNHFLDSGDPGALVNVAGAGILDTADDYDLVVRFINFLLSEQAQRYFAAETFEYPLAAGVDPDPSLPSLDELHGFEFNLADLADLKGTLELLQETGVIP
jgi:iron(III) transport system substrate-binding protein